MRRSLAAACCLLLVLSAVSCDDPNSPVALAPRAGGLDVTFLVAADPHFGATTVVRPPPGSQLAFQTVRVAGLHNTIIERMNGIEGQAYPPDIGGAVGKPAGLLIAGDLTDSGTIGQFVAFKKHYGLTGRDGLLNFPVYEGVGNHDWTFGPWISLAVALRHCGKFYSLDWGDLHVACLSEAPGDAGRRWLIRDLAAVGRDRPIVLYFHYPLTGPHSANNWFSRDGLRDKFAEAIAGFNIVAIFHGHFHGSGYYRWRGRDVYNVGSPKHGWRSFAVVRVTDRRMTVCSWNYELGDWWWWHDKPINGSEATDARVVLGVGSHAPDGRAPLIPYPVDDLRP